MSAAQPDPRAKDDGARRNTEPADTTEDRPSVSPYLLRPLRSLKEVEQARRRKGGKPADGKPTADGRR
jgi:hypothetical protein